MSVNTTKTPDTVTSLRVPHIPSSFSGRTWISCFCHKKVMNGCHKMLISVDTQSCYQFSPKRFHLLYLNNWSSLFRRWKSVECQSPLPPIPGLSRWYSTIKGHLQVWSGVLSCLLLPDSGGPTGRTLSHLSRPPAPPTTRRLLDTHRIYLTDHPHVTTSHLIPFVYSGCRSLPFLSQKL